MLHSLCAIRRPIAAGLCKNLQRNSVARSFSSEAEMKEPEKDGSGLDELPHEEFPNIYSSDYLTNLTFDRVRTIETQRGLMDWRDTFNDGKEWPNTWSSPEPFKPNKVPFDVRMGKKLRTVPKRGRYANTEFLKVQNFLHLTPPAIKKHCKELKKFCTKWPKQLKTDEDCEREFPVEIHTTDYVRAGQSQRNPKARITDLKIRLCHLSLNQHARHKIIALSGNRYDPKTDILHITAERCPIRKQNRQYLNYLLTVLYYESWKKEKWEVTDFMEEEDGLYWWHDSNSYKNLFNIISTHSGYRSIFENLDSGSDMPVDVKNKILDDDAVKKYCASVTKLKLPEKTATAQDKLDAVQQYKESTTQLLKLSKLK